MLNLKNERAKHNLHPYHSCLSRGKRLAHEFQIKIVRNAQYVLERAKFTSRIQNENFYDQNVRIAKHKIMQNIFFRRQSEWNTFKTAYFRMKFGEPCIRCYYPRERFRHLINAKAAAETIPGKGLPSFMGLVSQSSLCHDDSHAAGD